MSADEPRPGAAIGTSAPVPTAAVERDDWRHEPHPELYAAILARFAPTPAERRVALMLLALLRVPGVARLLRAWHAHRTR